MLPEMDADSLPENTPNVILFVYFFYSGDIKMACWNSYVIVLNWTTLACNMEGLCLGILQLNRKHQTSAKGLVQIWSFLLLNLLRAGTDKLGILSKPQTCNHSLYEFWCWENTPISLPLGNGWCEMETPLGPAAIHLSRSPVNSWWRRSSEIRWNLTK